MTGCKATSSSSSAKANVCSSIHFNPLPPPPTVSLQAPLLLPLLVVIPLLAGCTSDTTGSQHWTVPMPADGQWVLSRPGEELEFTAYSLTAPGLNGATTTHMGLRLDSGQSADSWLGLDTGQFILRSTCDASFWLGDQSRAARLFAFTKGQYAPPFALLWGSDVPTLDPHLDEAFQDARGLGTQLEFWTGASNQSVGGEELTSIAWQETLHTAVRSEGRYHHAAWFEYAGDGLPTAVPTPAGTWTASANVGSAAPECSENQAPESTELDAWGAHTPPLRPTVHQALAAADRNPALTAFQELRSDAAAGLVRMGHLNARATNSPFDASWTLVASNGEETAMIQCGIPSKTAPPSTDHQSTSCVAAAGQFDPAPPPDGVIASPRHLLAAVEEWTSEQVVNYLEDHTRGGLLTVTTSKSQVVIDLQTGTWTTASGTAAARLHSSS